MAVCASLVRWRTRLGPLLLQPVGKSVERRCYSVTFMRQYSFLSSRIRQPKFTVHQCQKLRSRGLGIGLQVRHLFGWGQNASKSKRLGIKNATQFWNDLRSRMPQHVKRAVTICTVAVTVLMLGSKVINILVPLQFKKLVDYLNENIGLNVDTQENSILTGAVAIVLGYFLARIGANFAQELRNGLFSIVDQAFVRNLGRRFFEHLHSLDSAFHAQRKLGALQQARDRGIRGLSNIVRALVQNIVPTMFEFGLVGILLYVKCGWQYTAVVALCVGTYTVFTVKVTQMRNEIRLAQNKAETRANNKVSDSLLNYETIKLFNNEASETEEYDKCLREAERAALKTQFSLALLNFGQNCIISSGLLAVMYLACGDIASGVLTVGDLVMVNQLLFQLSVPLNFLGTFWRDLSTAVIDLQDLHKLLQRAPKIQSAKNAPHLHIPSDAAPGIVFDDVKFHYVEDKPILKGLSLEVPSGKKIAIVGGSGSGKSTLVRLLYRMYDPISGRVLINDQDVKGVDVDSLRRIIGIVPQDTVLFHNNVYYNIAYGDKRASEDEVYAAAKMAEIHDTIMGFAQQYRTEVGERGLQLSGGEKQRIAIARAILKNPSIFVYDEATSSLDSITEDKIMKALERVTKNRTTIVIAHRLSTVVAADEICVLDDGQVAERGNHYQLLSKTSSLYYDLWMKQHEAFLTNSEYLASTHWGASLEGQSSPIIENNGNENT